jgi:membrane protease YdiL (CAAX protease family)
MSEEPPLPSPVGAAVLTLLAWFTVVLGWALLEEAGPALGLAVGLCLGFGGVGTLAARAVPAPADLRLGLRGFAPRFALPILLMFPAVVLASEIDNWVRPLFPAQLPGLEAAAAGAVAERYAAFEAVITLVLLRPVLEEFFFRGVVQQGLVAHLGFPAGLLQTALLSGLASGGLMLPVLPDRAASAAAEAAFAGLLLGVLRQGSGSLLAPMLAAVLMQSAGVTFAAAAERFPIQGFTGPPGEHTPLWILAACAAPVVLGCVLALRLREAPGDPLPGP